jgi:hypothetical protein
MRSTWAEPAPAAQGAAVDIEAQTCTAIGMGASFLCQRTLFNGTQVPPTSKIWSSYATIRRCITRRPRPHYQRNMLPRSLRAAWPSPRSLFVVSVSLQSCALRSTCDAYVLRYTSRSGPSIDTDRALVSVPSESLQLMRCLFARPHKCALSDKFPCVSSCTTIGSTKSKPHCTSCRIRKALRSSILCLT